MIARLGSVLSRWSRRFAPDPFVLALGLTVVVLIVAAIRLWWIGKPVEDGIAASLARGWLDGFSLEGGLAFALQMCLVLVTGHAMALSPPVQRAIGWISGLPRSPGAASALVAFVACAAALIHWGLGAIAGALLAREMGRHAKARGLALHYPLLGAASYAGMAVWHGGLSGSAPLKVAEGDVAKLIGTLPLSELLLSPVNLLVTGGLVVLIPILMWWMTPRHAEELVAPRSDQLEPLPERRAEPTPHVVDWLQESAWPGRILGVAGLLVVGGALTTGLRSLEINTVNLLFFFTGLALQGSLRCYVDAVADGARGAGAIIIQFPLYYGILGLMKASGMISWLSDGMVRLSSAESFPIITYWSAGFVNLFVPSGGGQWGVQKDILLEAGNTLQVDPTLTVMAFSYGDAWTNMLQPFWALPLLGIMGLKARDIIGYTAMIFLLMALWVPLCLWLAT